VLAAWTVIGWFIIMAFALRPPRVDIIPRQSTTSGGPVAAPGTADYLRWALGVGFVLICLILSVRLIGHAMMSIAPVQYSRNYGHSLLNPPPRKPSLSQTCYPHPANKKGSEQLAGNLIYWVLGLIVLAVPVLYLLRIKPSLVKDWSPDQKLLPLVEFEAPVDVARDVKFTIRNIRRIHYRTSRDHDLDYYDREFDLNDLTNAWLAISPFAGFGAAHAFLSFGFADDTYINVSIEVRRTRGKQFNPLLGVLRQFEIMYVIADESDVIWLRTNCARNDVRLYPIKTEIEKIRSVFLDILMRVNKLSSTPEFYHTVFNNCTTNIIKHTRKFAAKPIPFWNIRYLFPDTVDKIAYRLGIIDTDLNYDEAREHFNIKDLARSFEKEARKAKDRSGFSQAIRARFQ